jgi:hypothetical protein
MDLPATKLLKIIPVAIEGHGTEIKQGLSTSEGPRPPFSLVRDNLTSLPAQNFG